VDADQLTDAAGGGGSGIVAARTRDIASPPAR